MIRLFFVVAFDINALFKEREKEFCVAEYSLRILMSGCQVLFVGVPSLS